MDSPGPGPVMTVVRTAGGDPPATPPAPPERRWRRFGPGRPGWVRGLLIAVVVSWAVVITAVVLLRSGGNPPAPVTERPPASPSASDAPPTVAQIYQAVRPPVVLIRATGGRSSVDCKQETEVATGTGVIVNADGTILT